MKPEDTEEDSSIPASRVILLVTIPLLTSCILSVYLIASLIGANQQQQSLLIGNAIAKQLGASVSEYMLTEDRLSLTVLLNELVTEGVFSSATIYGADNRLVAAAGNATNNADSVFTAEIPYQDSVAGYVHISLSAEKLFVDGLSTIFMIVAANLVLMLIGGFYAFKVAAKLTRPRLTAAEDVSYEPKAKGGVKKERTFSLPIITAPSRPDHKSTPLEFDDFSMLVLKIRPPRIIDELRSSIRKAVSLYKGRIESFDEEEITVLFTQETDQCFQAACTALVIQSLTKEIKYGECKAGMACGSNKDEMRQVRKQASYFASVANNEVLVSEAVYLRENIYKKVEIAEFHSSMAPDSQLYKISGLIDSHQNLIDSQARQLARTSDRHSS
jgi:uncharacterized membrane protein affecting hemolysin expression